MASNDLSKFTEDKSILSVVDYTSSSAPIVSYSPLQHPLKDPVPKSAYSKLGYITILMQGVAILVPWNAILISLDFFYPKGGFATGVYMGCAFGFVILFTIFGDRFCNVKKSRFSILLTFISMVIMCVIGLIVVIKKDNALKTSIPVIIIMMICLVALAFAAACGNNGFFMLFASIPDSRASTAYLQGFSSGQGVAGVITGTISYIVYLAFRNTSPASDEELIMRNNKFCTFNYIILSLIPLCSYAMYHKMSKSLIITNQQTAPKLTINQVEQEKESLSTFDCFKAAIPYEYSITMMFFVTLFILTSNMINQPSTFEATTFFQKLFVSTEDALLNNRSKQTYNKILVVALFGIFQYGDWIGKLLPMISALNFNSPLCFILVATGRLLLFTGYFTLRLDVCPLMSTTMEFFKRLPLIYRIIFDEWCVAFMIFLMGITGGYFSTLVFMHAHSSVSSKDTKAQATVGNLMVLFLYFGLFSGTFINKLIP